MWLASHFSVLQNTDEQYEVNTRSHPIWCPAVLDCTCCAMLALADLPMLSYASMLLSLANALSLSLHAYMIRVVYKAMPYVLLLGYPRVDIQGLLEENCW